MGGRGVAVSPASGFITVAGCNILSRSQAGADYSTSCLRISRLRRPCRRLDKPDSAFELRQDKQPSAVTAQDARLAATPAHPASKSLCKNKNLFKQRYKNSETRFSVVYNGVRRQTKHTKEKRVHIWQLYHRYR